MSQSQVSAYLAQLSPQEQRVLKIAREHLESSFNLLKSVGFIEWQAQQMQAQQMQAQQMQAQQENAVGTGTITLQPLQSKL